jgi:predicted AAA+ superfamily ATPase
MIYMGSYPAVVLKKYDPETFYANYVKTYIERDVQQIIGITNQLKFTKFLTIIAARTAQAVNYHDLATECEISEPTAKS